MNQIGRFRHPTEREEGGLLSANVMIISGVEHVVSSKGDRDNIWKQEEKKNKGRPTYTVVFIPVNLPSCLSECSRFCANPLGGTGGSSEP
jgi:hypothetical protein